MLIPAVKRMYLIIIATFDCSWYLLFSVSQRVPIQTVLKVLFRIHQCITKLLSFSNKPNIWAVPAKYYLWRFCLLMLLEWLAIRNPLLNARELRIFLTLIYSRVELYPESFTLSFFLGPCWIAVCAVCEFGAKSLPLCVWCVGRRNLSTAIWKSSTAHCGPCTCNCAKPPATGDCIYSFSLFAMLLLLVLLH